jgi:hypothetical protein
LLAGLLARVLVLLTRVLVLLARILVLVGHRGSPLLNAVRDKYESRSWFQGNSSSTVIIAWQLLVATAARRNPGQTSYVQDLRAAPRAVAAPGSHC